MVENNRIQAFNRGQLYKSYITGHIYKSISEEVVGLGYSHLPVILVYINQSYPVGGYIGDSFIISKITLRKVNSVVKNQLDTYND